MATLVTPQLRDQDASGSGAVGAPLETTHVYRELNDIEYFAWCLGQPYNIVVEVQLSGVVKPEALRAALRKAQMRHPLLAVNTEPGPRNVPWFSSDGVGEIPLVVVESAEPDAATGLVESELVTPFAMDRAAVPRLPLMRASLLLHGPGGAGASLVLTTHHVVADGLSLVFLMRDLLGFLAQPDAPLEVADALASPEELLPAAVRRRIPRTATRFHVVLFFVRAWAQLALRLRPPPAVSYSHHRRFWELDEAQTAGLLARCRREGVSVHAALCTAFLPDFPAIHTAVSVRALLARPVGECVGDLVGSAMVRLRYRRGRSFWANARRFHPRLRRGLVNPFGMYLLFSKAVSQELMDQLGPLLVKLQGKARPFGITNLGRLDDRAAELFDGTQLRLESFFGAMTPKFDASAVSVYTVRGRMRLNLLAREAVSHPTGIRDDSARAIARLITAIDP